MRITLANGSRINIDKIPEILSLTVVTSKVVLEYVRQCDIKK